MTYQVAVALLIACFMVGYGIGAYMQGIVRGLMASS